MAAEDVHADEDDAVDGWMIGLLDSLACPDEDDRWRPNIDAEDVLAAADERGLAIATVYKSLGREERAGTGAVSLIVFRRVMMSVRR